MNTSGRVSAFAANHGPDTAMTVRGGKFRGSQVEIVDVQSEITVGAGMRETWP